MARIAEIFGSSIVAVGEFNPAIFSPDWFEKNHLIGSEDAEQARDVKLGGSFVVSRQATSFQTEWFHLQVFENQLVLTSNGALTPAFKDLAFGTFSLVRQTPVTAVGLNFVAHFKFASDAEYYKVGDVLAPKEIWNTLYPGKNATGLFNLTIQFQDAERGVVPQSGNMKQIMVQPSSKVTSGVLLFLNNHHNINQSDDPQITSADQAAMLIDSDWHNLWEDAVRVFDSILTQALSAPL